MPVYPGRAACLYCHRTHGLVQCCHVYDPKCIKRDESIKGPCRYCYETYAYEYECHGTDPKCYGKGPPEQQPGMTLRHPKTPWYVEIPHGYKPDMEGVGSQDAINILPAGRPDEKRPPGVDFVPPFRCIPDEPAGPSEMQRAFQRVESLSKTKSGRRFSREIRRQLQQELLSVDDSEVDPPIQRTIEQHVEHQMLLRQQERKVFEDMYGSSLVCHPGDDGAEFHKEFQAKLKRERLEDNMFKALYERHLRRNATSSEVLKDGESTSPEQDALREQLKQQLNRQNDISIQPLAEQLGQMLISEVDENRRIAGEEEMDSEATVSVHEKEQEQQSNDAIPERLDPMIKQAKDILQKAIDRATHGRAMLAASKAAIEQAASGTEEAENASQQPLHQITDSDGETARKISTAVSKANAWIEQAKAMAAEIHAMADQFETDIAQAGNRQQQNVAAESSSSKSRSAPIAQGKSEAGSSSSKGKKKVSGGRKRK